MEKFVVHTPTQEDYDQLMRWAEELGYKWGGGILPTEEHYFGGYKEETAIYFRVEAKKISYGDMPFFKRRGGDYGKFMTMDDFAMEFMPEESMPEDFF